MKLKRAHALLQNDWLQPHLGHFLMLFKYLLCSTDLAPSHELDHTEQVDLEVMF